MIIFYDKGYFLMTESVVLSDKFEFINTNPMVSLRFSKGQSIIVVNGKAEIERIADY